MAQCPTILPLCCAISSLVLGWINLLMIRWEVIFAWWEKKSALRREWIGNGDGACSEWGEERWAVKFGVLLLFYCAVLTGREHWGWSLHVQALRGGLTPNLAVVPLPFVSLGAQCPPRGQCCDKPRLSVKVFVNSDKNLSSWWCSLGKTAPGRMLGQGRCFQTPPELGSRNPGIPTAFWAFQSMEN